MSSGPRIGLGDLNPLDWLGDAAGELAGETWSSAMVSVWSGGLWLLDLSFRALDSLTSPDLSAGGPMGSIYPYTFGLGLVVALIMAFGQIGVAAYRRDGQSLGRVIIGVAQFGAVWVGYIAVAAALVTAAAGLTRGLLDGLLDLDGFSGYSPTASWPRQVNDNVTATVLGLCSLLLVIPASIAYLLMMLVREAALLLLAATSPIAAGGLMSEVGRVWFWKSLRWFIAALLIAPLSALVLGVGNRIAQGVVSGAGEDTAAAVGMAVVGCVLVLVGALCPMILFRLLAFVDPGTTNGAAMRSSLAAQGGISGLLGSRGSGSGSAAAQSDGAGRSSGEATADAATESRFATTLVGGANSALGSAIGAMGKVAQGAVSIGSDVASASGVGHQAPYYPAYQPSGNSSGSAPGRSAHSPGAPASPSPSPGPGPAPASARAPVEGVAPAQASSAEAGLAAAG